MLDLDRIPVIASPHRTVVGSPPRKIDVVVIHDMEAPEGALTAENVAKYFQTTDKEVSAHYCVDNNSIVQCVPLADVAWAAPGANSNGIQIEYAGYAKQTAAQWNDAYSAAMLKLGAELTAHLCKRFNIPVKFLDAAALKRGERGITTHAQVTLAWHKSTHTDPGPNFPIAKHIMDVRIELAKLRPPIQVAYFQIVNNGKVIATSDKAQTPTAAGERIRLASFLHNHIFGIHKALAADPDGSLQIVRKKADLV